jgi:hypothetical protein
MCTSREVATRYDHTGSSLIGFVLLACIRLWIRFDLPDPRKGSCGPLDSNRPPPRQLYRLRRLFPNPVPTPRARGIALALPRLNLGCENLSFTDAAVRTMATRHTGLNLHRVQPTGVLGCVTKLQALEGGRSA